MTDLDALLDRLRDDMPDEGVTALLLEETLAMARREDPAFAAALEVCALPAWFDEDYLAAFRETLPPTERTAAELLAWVLPRPFVRRHPAGGHALHEAVRAALLDRLRADPARHAALVDRLARYYVALAREHAPRLQGPDYLEALAALDAAQANIRAAWEGATETEQWAHVRSFAYATPYYLRFRGLWTEAIAWTQAGLEACRHLDDEAGAADMQIILGNAYANLPIGDRAANLEQAIECYQEALRFFTPEAAPLDYAMTQNNLGNAYADLPTGDRAANLQQAIECYHEALRFWTPETVPLDYATTQNNLGIAYGNLPTGDRAANLEKAIVCYQEALRFFTPEAAPLDYAMTQNNLGNAYADLPTGDRAANLEQAIECYQEALRFHTREAAPRDYVRTQNNLGLAYLYLQKYERAFEELGRALAVDPEDATTHYNTACAHALLGHAAEACAWLEKAIALDERCRERAQEDADFDGIREGARFQALVG